MTGIPAAMASKRAFGFPSSREGKTKRSQTFMISATSSRSPKNSTRPVRARELARSSSLALSSPSPTMARLYSENSPATRTKALKRSSTRFRSTRRPTKRIVWRFTRPNRARMASRLAGSAKGANVSQSTPLETGRILSGLTPTWTNSREI